MALTEFGVLSKEYLQGLLLRTNNNHTAEVESLKNKMIEIQTEIKRKEEEKSHVIINSIYEFFDINMSLFRRRKVNKIYEDLSAMRISYTRAREELLKIIERDIKK